MRVAEVLISVLIEVPEGIAAENSAELVVEDVAELLTATGYTYGQGVELVEVNEFEADEPAHDRFDEESGS